MWCKDLFSCEAVNIEEPTFTPSSELTLMNFPDLLKCVSTTLLQMPEQAIVLEYQEPMVLATIICPDTYIGAIMPLVMVSMVPCHLLNSQYITQVLSKGSLQPGSILTKLLKWVPFDKKLHLF